MGKAPENLLLLKSLVDEAQVVGVLRALAGRPSDGQIPRCARACCCLPANASARMHMVMNTARILHRNKWRHHSITWIVSSPDTHHNLWNDGMDSSAKWRIKDR